MFWLVSFSTKITDSRFKSSIWRNFSGCATHETKDLLIDTFALQKIVIVLVAVLAVVSSYPQYSHRFSERSDSSYGGRENGYHYNGTRFNRNWNRHSSNGKFTISPPKHSQNAEIVTRHMALHSCFPLYDESSSKFRILL